LLKTIRDDGNNSTNILGNENSKAVNKLG